jgi:hypothetical protein
MGLCIVWFYEFMEKLFVKELQIKGGLWNVVTVVVVVLINKVFGAKSKA